MDEAIELALQQNPRVKATHKLTDAQHDQANVGPRPSSPFGARFHQLLLHPEFRTVEQRPAVWGFGGSTSGSGEQFGAGLHSFGHQPLGGYASASASQPILGLLHLSEDYLAAADQA